ncbi:hypothetical protein C8Q75DRAFT_770156 [Abortiporus biennis]|nr:hypothetical protein C8Q75DRAFT_770156 [Abortiporus biennis]
MSAQTLIYVSAARLRDALAHAPKRSDTSYAEWVQGCMKETHVAIKITKQPRNIGKLKIPRILRNAAREFVEAKKGDRISNLEDIHDADPRAEDSSMEGGCDIPENLDLGDDQWWKDASKKTSKTNQTSSGRYIPPANPPLRAPLLPEPSQPHIAAMQPRSSSRDSLKRKSPAEDDEDTEEDQLADDQSMKKDSTEPKVEDIPNSSLSLSSMPLPAPPAASSNRASQFKKQKVFHQAFRASRTLPPASSRTLSTRLDDNEFYIPPEFLDELNQGPLQSATSCEHCIEHGHICKVALGSQSRSTRCLVCGGGSGKKCTLLPQHRSANARMKIARWYQYHAREDIRAGRPPAPNPNAALKVYPTHRVTATTSASSPPARPKPMVTPSLSNTQNLHHSDHFIAGSRHFFSPSRTSFLSNSLSAKHYAWSDLSLANRPGIRNANVLNAAVPSSPLLQPRVPAGSSTSPDHDTADFLDRTVLRTPEPQAVSNEFSLRVKSPPFLNPFKDISAFLSYSPSLGARSSSPHVTISTSPLSNEDCEHQDTRMMKHSDPINSVVPATPTPVARRKGRKPLVEFAGVESRLMQTKKLEKPGNSNLAKDSEVNANARGSQVHGSSQISHESSNVPLRRSARRGQIDVPTRSNEGVTRDPGTTKTVAPTPSYTSSVSASRILRSRPTGDMHSSLSRRPPGISARTNDSSVMTPRTPQHKKISVIQTPTPVSQTDVTSVDVAPVEQLKMVQDKYDALEARLSHMEEALTEERNNQSVAMEKIMERVVVSHENNKALEEKFQTLEATCIRHASELENFKNKEIVALKFQQTLETRIGVLEEKILEQDQTKEQEEVLKREHEEFVKMLTSQTEEIAQHIAKASMEKISAMWNDLKGRHPTTSGSSVSSGREET